MSAVRGRGDNSATVNMLEEQLGVVEASLAEIEQRVRTLEGLAIRSLPKHDIVWSGRAGAKRVVGSFLRYRATLVKERGTDRWFWRLLVSGTTLGRGIALSYRAAKTACAKCLTRELDGFPS